MVLFVTSSYQQFARFCLSPNEEIIQQYNPKDSENNLDFHGYTTKKKNEREKTTMKILCHINNSKTQVYYCCTGIGT